MTDHERTDEYLPTVPVRRHRRPTDAQIERACHPSVADRAITEVGYVLPELTGAAVTGAAAATVWAPLGLIAAALVAKAAGERVWIAWCNHRARTPRPATVCRREETAEPTDVDEPARAGERGEWEVAG